MKPRTKIIIYYSLHIPGSLLLIIDCFLWWRGTPVEKVFPLNVIAVVLIIAALIFLPRKKDFEALKLQKEQENKEKPYQK